MKTAPARRAAVAAAAALLLSSCGSLPSELDFLKGQHEFLDQSPRSMAKASFADMQDVTSMRVLGQYDDDDYGYVSVDLRVGKDGCQGSIDTDGDGGFQLRLNDDGTWIRADERFWQTQADTFREGDEAWKVIGYRWLLITEKKSKSDFLKLCNLEAFLAEFQVKPEDTEESLDTEDVVEVGNVDTVPITGGKGKKRTTIWVSLDAPHYVLKTAPVRDKGLPDALYLEEFGTKVVVESPAKKDVFKLPDGTSPI